MKTNNQHFYTIDAFLRNSYDYDKNFTITELSIEDNVMIMTGDKRLDSNTHIHMIITYYIGDCEGRDKEYIQKILDKVFQNENKK